MRNTRGLRTAVLSQQLFDDETLKALINREVHDEGWTHRFGFQAAAKLLAAPIVDEQHVPMVRVQHYLVAPDAHLDLEGTP